ncbi:MAG: hypothetical protein LBJ25_08355 [Candidatus Margulisbacteria bacterium]|nr:hypothetical protein [Candidatus Margulisiibacteriota bacterium]
MANADNYSDTYTGITTGAPLSAATMTAALNTKEKVANKQASSADDTADTLTANSSDSYYPTSKLVGKNFDALNNAKQDKLAADIAKNIVAYSGTAGTLGTLTRTTTIDTATNASDDNIPTEKAVATALSGNENTSNKAASITVANKDDAVKYPTTGAVTAWVSAELAGIIDLVLPIGTIIAMRNTTYYNSSDAAFKAKWKICDGNGGTPNLRNLFLRGMEEGGTAAVGIDSVTLVAANLPAHTHTVNDPGHTHTIPINWSHAGNSGADRATATSPDSSYDSKESTTGITVTGGGGSPQTAVPIVPKYFAVIYVMKVA